MREPETYFSFGSLVFVVFISFIFIATFCVQPTVGSFRFRVIFWAVVGHARMISAVFKVSGYSVHIDGLLNC